MPGKLRKIATHATIRNWIPVPAAGGRSQKESAMSRAPVRHAVPEHILASNVAAIVVFDRHGVILYANAAAEAILGLSPGEATGRRHDDPAWRITTVDGQALATDDLPVDRVLRSGQPVQDARHTFEHPDGTRRILSVNAAPLPETAHADGRVVAALRDITAQAAAEHALRQQEAELAAAQRIARLGSWVSDFVHDEIRWSDEVYRIFGLTRDQWGATHDAFMQAVHPDDRARVQQAVEAALAGAPYDLEHRVLRPDGSERTVHEQGTVDFDADGRPLRMIGTVHDITEQRAAEDARRRLTAILDHSPDIVAMHGPDGEMQYLNAAGRRWHGLDDDGAAPPDPTSGWNTSPLPAEAARVETTIEHFHPRWAAQKVAHEGLPTALREGVWQGETAIWNARGDEVPVAQVILANRDPASGRPHVSTILRDISEQKALEQQLQRRQRVLHDLLQVTSDPTAGLDSKLHQILQVGADFLGLPGGRIDQGAGPDRRLRWSHPPHDPVNPDAPAPPCDTATDTGAVADPAPPPKARDIEGTRHAADPSDPSTPCLTTPVVVNGEVYATLTFSGTRPRAPFDDFECEIVQLIAQWVGYELGRETQRQALERERNLFIGGPTVVLQRRNEPGWPVEYVSPNIAAQFGYRPVQLTANGAGFATLLHPEDHAALVETVQHHQDQCDTHFECEYRIRDAAGRYRWVHDSTVIQDLEGSGAPSHLYSYLVDITKRRELETELKQLAFHDPLTGIANRRQLQDLLDAEAHRATRYASDLSVIMLDVDHFKPINDRYGHAIGDLVLQELVRVVGERLRSIDTLGRWGGEEFLILLPETDSQGAHRLATELREAIAATAMPGPGEITVSQGVAQYRPGEPARDLIKRADDALYQAKRSGRDQVIESA